MKIDAILPKSLNKASNALMGSDVAEVCKKDITLKPFQNCDLKSIEKDCLTKSEAKEVVIPEVVDANEMSVNEKSEFVMRVFDEMLNGKLRFPFF